MMTIRQIERFWAAKAYPRLVAQLVAMRPEGSARLEMALGRAVPAAAMTIIRLDELNQSHTPLCAQLLRILLAAQEADGGWGDGMATALCIRALMCGSGSGAAIERGIEYLANLQKTDGLWPRIPIRRTPADPFLSAFILFHLGPDPRFAAAVRVADTIGWFESHTGELDEETARLWRAAALRCGRRTRPMTRAGVAA